jgi:hypothetical protein
VTRVVFFVALLRGDCEEQGRSKWLLGAAMDALSTKCPEFAQGFYAEL